MPRDSIPPARRAAWIKEHGPCASCGSWDYLEVDHVEPETKAVRSTSNIWLWSSKARREAELVKCQVLCHMCHKDKTSAESAAEVQHGTLHMYKSPRYNCRCDACVLAYANYQREYRRSRKVAKIRAEIRAS